jgi:hypothetical protein
MKILLLFLFGLTLNLSDTIQKEILIYNFVLDDLSNFYSIDNITLFNEQSYFIPIPNDNFKKDVFKIIAKKGDRIHHESQKLENFSSYLKNPVIKNRIPQKEFENYFLDTNSSAEKGWEIFYNKYFGNFNIVSLSPIIYTKKNKFIYVLCTFIDKNNGNGILYKLRFRNEKLYVVERHKTWHAN